MPMLDYLKGLDFDAILHLDIAFDGHDIEKVVREVFRVFGNTGLLITACPSAHSIMPWENTLAMVDEWKKLRSDISS